MYADKPNPRINRPEKNAVNFIGKWVEGMTQTKQRDVLLRIAKGMETKKFSDQTTGILWDGDKKEIYRYSDIAVFIKTQLAELDRVERESAHHEQRMKHFEALALENAIKYDELQEENERMRAALRFYADGLNYAIAHIGCSSNIAADRGTIAHQALSSLSTEGESSC